MTSPTRVAVITGAAQGIGRTTAECLARQGYALALIDKNAQAETAAAIAHSGGEPPLMLELDLTADDAAERCAAAVAGRFGRCDVLVNNAGISAIIPAEAIRAADLRHVLEVNLVAPFRLCQVFGAMMLRHGAGSIVNVASIAGLFGVTHRAAYNASKHGLIGLTRTLAGEWGGRGVRVNAVCPGWVKTAMDDDAQHAGLYTDADIIGRVPMGRFASSEDIARAIAYLADSAQSGFVNGHTLVVDGGWTADASWDALRRRAAQSESTS